MDQKTEDRLLLYCLGVGNEKVALDSIGRLSPDDLDELIRKTGKHGITPLFYQCLKSLNPNTGDIPASFLKRLRSIYLYSTEKNMRLYHHLAKVLEAFNENGVPVIVMKGAALAEGVYGNIGLRPMVDADLLVKGKDIWESDNALSQLGYESNLKKVTLSRWHAQWIHHIEYSNGAFHIDIHPKTNDLPNIDPWEKAVPAKIASIDTLVLGPEDFLLNLCLHLERHLHMEPPKLLQWYDILALTKHYRDTLDWDYVVRVVKKHRIEGQVFRILHVINEGMEGNIPQNALCQLETDGAAISIEDVLHPAEEGRYGRKQAVSEDRELDSFLSSISRIPAIHDKIHYFFVKLFPCKNFMIHRYSIKRPKLFYLYYFMPVVELVVKVAKSLFQLPGHLRKKRVSSRSERTA